LLLIKIIQFEHIYSGSAALAATGTGAAEEFLLRLLVTLPSHMLGWDFGAFDIHWPGLDSAASTTTRRSTGRSTPGSTGLVIDVKMWLYLVGAVGLALNVLSCVKAQSMQEGWAGTYR
jgi:hypothetical protein